MPSSNNSTNSITREAQTAVTTARSQLTYWCRVKCPVAVQCLCTRYRLPVLWWCMWRSRPVDAFSIRSLNGLPRSPFPSKTIRAIEALLFNQLTR